MNFANDNLTVLSKLKACGLLRCMLASEREKIQ